MGNTIEQNFPTPDKSNWEPIQNPFQNQLGIRSKTLQNQYEIHPESFQNQLGIVKGQSYQKQKSVGIYQKPYKSNWKSMQALKINGDLL